MKKILLLLIFVYVICSCNSELATSLEYAGDNREEMVFDNFLTGFEGTNPDDNRVGLKLSSPKQVSKLRFFPRTDGNCIEIGDKYKLRFWTGSSWKIR